MNTPIWPPPAPKKKRPILLALIGSTVLLFGVGSFAAVSHKTAKAAAPTTTQAPTTTTEVTTTVAPTTTTSFYATERGSIEAIKSAPQWADVTVQLQANIDADQRGDLATGAVHSYNASRDYRALAKIGVGRVQDAMTQCADALAKSGDALAAGDQTALNVSTAQLNACNDAMAIVLTIAKSS